MTDQDFKLYTVLICLTVIMTMVFIVAAWARPVKCVYCRKPTRAYKTTGVDGSAAHFNICDDCMDYIQRTYILKGRQQEDKNNDQ